MASARPGRLFAREKVSIHIWQRGWVEGGKAIPSKNQDVQRDPKESKPSLAEISMKQRGMHTQFLPSTSIDGQ